MLKASQMIEDVSPCKWASFKAKHGNVPSLTMTAGDNGTTCERQETNRYVLLNEVRFRCFTAIGQVATQTSCVEIMVKCSAICPSCCLTVTFHP